jgi:hypothetical protein
MLPGFFLRFCAAMKCSQLSDPSKRNTAGLILETGQLERMLFSGASQKSKLIRAKIVLKGRIIF